MEKFHNFSVIQVQQPLNEKADIQVSGLKKSVSYQELKDIELQKLRSLDFLLLESILR